MIFYFTGTGNSLYVAENIAHHQNDRLISIRSCMQENLFEFSVEKNESIGFSFPVYFWGMPSIIEEFINNFSLSGYEKNYIYVIFNCGGSIGSTDYHFKKKLKKRGYSLKASFSVFMPDNYILLADLLTPPHEIPRLLNETDEKLPKINDIIAQKSKSNLPLHKKRWAWLESVIVHPYYKRKKSRSTKPFHTTEECTSCGLCADICPCGTIQMNNGRPVWGEECTQCLACLHRCPTEAIQYGEKTYTRGRYVNPKCTWN